MKTTSLSLVLSALLIPAVLQAQPAAEKGPPPPGGQKKEGPPRGPNFDQMWKRADANSDGFVTPEEFAMLPRMGKVPEDRQNQIFKRLDKNSDGKLSREEMEQMAERGKMLLQQLKEMDTDKSGGISFEEFKSGELIKKMPPEKQANIFKRLDTDGDGQITPKDKPQRPKDGGPGRLPGGPPPSPQEIIKHDDANGDGALSFDEFRKSPPISKLSEDEQEDKFEAMDKNKDQKLTEDELSAPSPPPVKPPAPAGKAVVPEPGIH